MCSVCAHPDQMATAEVGVVQGSPGALHADGKVAETEVGGIWGNLGALHTEGTLTGQLKLK